MFVMRTVLLFFLAALALDTAALLQSADDFADAPEASVHEKLLEALTNRFELYAPLRAQMPFTALPSAIRHWRCLLGWQI